MSYLNESSKNENFNLFSGNGLQQDNNESKGKNKTNCICWIIANQIKYHFKQKNIIIN